MGFGASIKKLREDAKISAQKLADAMGVDAERLRKWEQLDSTPRFEDVAAIERFFSKPMNEVMKLKSIKEFLNVPSKNTSSKQTRTHESEAGLDNQLSEPHIPLMKKQTLDEQAQNEKSLHIMIENSLELNIAHKNVTATNLKLTAMLETLINGKPSSGTADNISSILAPYLQLIAAGGAGRFWKDESAGRVELGKILNAHLGERKELRKK